MAEINETDLSIGSLREEQRQRWLAGDFMQVEGYLAQQPGLADDDELLLDFIYSEFCLAEELRRSPRPVDYLVRFPRFRDELRALFEVHHAMDDGRNASLVSHGVTGRLEDFDAAWRQGEPPDLNKFFRGGEVDEMATRAPVDRRLAEELVMLDIEHRWKMSGTAAHRLVTGKAPMWANPRLEDYVENYPELGTLEQFSQKAITWEYYVRHRWGDCPAHAEYMTRFPWLQEQLKAELPRIDQELAKEFSIRRPRKQRKPKKKVRTRSKEVIKLKVAGQPDEAPRPTGDVSTKPLPPGAASPSADRNMLLGILALQMDFINREQLVEGMNAWVLDKSKSLSQLLLERGALSAKTHVLLEELVERHIEIHGNDAAQSLAAVSSPADVQQQLSNIADEDVQATMSFVASGAPGAHPGAGSQTAGGQTMTYAGSGVSAAGGTRFRVLRPHAKGGLGEVFVALDTELHREVALKEIQTRFANLMDQRARFAMEAEITGRLEHPGIVPVYGMGYYPDGRPYYTMRFIKGDSFKAAIEHFYKVGPEKRDPGERTVEFRQLLRRFVDVCNAVAYAHSRGVLHRDIKPANVMLGAYGETLVVDWGLAKSAAMPDILGNVDEEMIRLSGDTAGTAPTQMGSVIGTPQFMSPEQALGKLDQLGPASDVYSLGATLYVLLTSKAAFTDRDLGALIQKVQKGEFPRPRELRSDVPKALEAICLKAMSVKREDRYQTGKELAEDVEHWLADEPVTAYREPLSARLVRWARYHKAAVTSVAAVLLVSMIAFGAWRWNEGRRLARLRTDSRELIAKGQDALAREDLDDAKLQLTNALARIGGESALEDLAHDTQHLLDQTNSQLAAQEEHAAARGKLDGFLALRDKVLFHGTLFTGIDIASNLAAAKDTAGEALAMFPLPDGAAAPNWPEAKHLTPEELQRVTQGVYETVLVLAEATAQVLPNEKSDPLKGVAALKVLDNAKKLGLETRAWHLRRAKYLFQSGQDTAAERENRAAESVEINGALDRFLVGDMAYQQQNLADAMGHFDEALRLEPDHFWAHYFLSVCHLQRNQPREAIAHLTASLSRRPDFAWIYLLRGYAYGQLDEFATAEADFLKAASLGADDYGYYINRGAMRIRQGKLDSAQKDFEEAARRQPDQYQAYVNVAEVHRQRKEYEPALTQLTKALRLAPRVATPHRVRAQVLLAQEKFDEAAKDFAFAVEYGAPGSPSLAEDLKNRGRMLHKLKRYAEALADYDAAQKILPDDLEIDRLRADALLALGKGAEALAAFNRYIDSKQLDADALRQRAFERVRVGDLAGALADFTRAVELDPKSAVTRGRRGWSYLNNSPRLALEDFEAAIKLEPTNGDLYNGRGFAKAQLGQYREAVADAEEALNLGAVSAALNERIGLLVNAACIHAVAAGKAAADPAEEPQKLAQQYESKAVSLVSQAAGIVRGDARAAFLRQTLADPAFDPIRHKPAFVELQPK